MPRFFNPARDSRHRASCFALYRALLRQVPRITLPSDLTSRSDWINPIQYLVRSGFRRNKNDTSLRLVTSALRSGYRFLTLLARAQDTSSASHAEVVTFLRDRQRSFPPPRPLPPVVEPKPRSPPLLTKISKPGERPVYKPTVRPLPLSQLSGGTRKVPVLEDAQGIPFLRIGKPQSHTLSNLLKRKAMRRQLRITAIQELWDERRHEAAEEDRWEATLKQLADREGVRIPDIGDEGSTSRKRYGGDTADPRMLEIGPFELAVREHGVRHISAQLSDELTDMQARVTALLDLRDEEQKLADFEKEEKKEQRRMARENNARLGKEQGPSEERPADKHVAGEQQDAPDPSGTMSKDAWARKFAGGRSQRARKAQS